MCIFIAVVFIAPFGFGFGRGTFELYALKWAHDDHYCFFYKIYRAQHDGKYAKPQPSLHPWCELAVFVEAIGCKVVFHEARLALVA